MAHGVAKSRTRLSDFTCTFHFHALEAEMATHSSVLAWRIPGTGEPGGLPSIGSHRVRHDWSDLAAAAGMVIIVLFTILYCFPVVKYGALIRSLPCSCHAFSFQCLTESLLSSFHRWDTGLRDAQWPAWVTQISSGRARVQTQPCLTPSGALFPLCPASICATCFQDVIFYRIKEPGNDSRPGWRLVPEWSELLL